MTRQFSGIKPSGEMHIGNYVGAVRRWVDSQDDGIFCVVDLHAMTVPFDPDEFNAETRRLAALLLAAGLDPDRCTLFVQSHVPVVTELTWILNCVASDGELRRMTQFKDKSQGDESVSAGLYDYPVLMAADIVLYELHVRDFSANDFSVSAPNRGKYLAFTETGSNGTCWGARAIGSPSNVT